ncbi:uncharacterized protein LOC129565090 [Sitodiplosis mosellana]|uniref:uncharacterized protein LOC129565090 n=1 Tax=Sitodiplosis mosellana TaxID=263140 RepID=UPI002444F836|nr:uncharacterized protein LOC129565090 [Sitodiplosis mosellana]
MDEVKCKRESDKPNDETFLLLSTSLNSIPSSLFATQTNTSSLVPNARNQHICATPSTTITSTATTTTTTTTIASDRNNKSTCVTNTMPLSKSAIVHTCCYKHHCQLSACHINNGEIQASTSKKLLLSVPLQRKRKKVVYNQDFIGAIGIDVSNVLDLTSDQRLVIAHYSCVEKFTKTNMYTPSLKESDSQTNPVIQSGDDQLISAIEQKEFPCPSDIISCESSENKCDNSLAESLNTQRINSTSPLSDEGLANASPYCSSGEEEETRAPVHEKVERSSSSDSALGLDEEILAGMAELSPRNQQRRMTLTVTDIPLQLLRPALLPVAEPTSLPDSPLAVQAPVDFFTSNIQAPVVVPSKMILEARIVEIPTPASPAQLNDNNKTSYFGQLSRRESCVSDTTADEIPPNHIRVVRTPSVVVSDYSDDVLCGITLEELEFFRQQRKSSLGATLDSPHSSATENTDYLSDISAASSCSNLNYCGSSISLLDDNYASSLSGVPTPERKLSSCSTCSTGQEYNNDEECNEANQFSNNLIEALNQQQRKKKVCNCISSSKASSHYPSSNSANMKKE